MVMCTICYIVWCWVSNLITVETSLVVVGFGLHGMPPTTSNPDLWPFDLETGVRVAYKVGNLAFLPNLGIVGLWVLILFAMNATERQKQCLLPPFLWLGAYCPLSYGWGIMTNYINVVLRLQWSCCWVETTRCVMEVSWTSSKLSVWSFTGQTPTNVARNITSTTQLSHSRYDRQTDLYFFLSSFLSFTRWYKPIHVPVLRSASRAGPVQSLRGGTSVVQHDTIRFAWRCAWSVDAARPLSFLMMSSASPLACSLVRAHPRERRV